MLRTMDWLLVLHVASAVVLLVIGALNIGLTKRRTGAHGRLGHAYLVLLFIALGSGMAIGARNPGISVFEILTPPTLALGVMGYIAARQRRDWLGQPWVAWHIRGQGGSYIGVVTATLFQTVPRVMPPSTRLAIALGVVPTVIGTVLIFVAIRRWTGRRKQTFFATS
jgi:hypothetical protein